MTIACNLDSQTESLGDLLKESFNNPKMEPFQNPQMKSVGNLTVKLDNNFHTINNSQVENSKNLLEKLLKHLKMNLFDFLQVKAAFKLQMDPIASIFI